MKRAHRQWDNSQAVPPVVGRDRWNLSRQRRLARVSRAFSLVRNHQLILFVAMLFALAFAIRLYQVDEPPVDFHATRQYRSLIIARALYLESDPSAPAWKREVARIARERQGILEPPVMEALTSVGYRIVGGERYWIPHALASAFWLIGGGFLFALAKRLASTDAAVVSLAIYLFLPFAVEASRSFQPDPLMVMGMIASTYFIDRYYSQPGTDRLIVACAASAATIFIKPVSLFAIFGAFAVLAIWTAITGGGRRYGASMAFAASSLLPLLGFYAYGVFFNDPLQQQAQASFIPRLFLDFSFWQGWVRNVHVVVGLPLFGLALLGVLLCTAGRTRALALGLWAGYGVFCVVFNYHISTHDYYHLQLVPLVALSLGLVSALALGWFRRRPTWNWRVGLVAIGMMALLVSLQLTRTRLASPDVQQQVRAAEEVGGLVKHSTETVYLDADYGLPLEYHGLLSGRPWPLASDLDWERYAGVRVLAAEERFNREFAGHDPEFFIVMNMGELEQQPDLEEFLSARFAVLASTDEYLIFDLRSTANHQTLVTIGAGGRC